MAATDNIECWADQVMDSDDDDHAQGAHGRQQDRQGAAAAADDASTSSADALPVHMHRARKSQAIPAPKPKLQTVDVDTLNIVITMLRALEGRMTALEKAVTDLSTEIRNDRMSTPTFLTGGRRGDLMKSTKGGRTVVIQPANK